MNTLTLFYLIAAVLAVVGISAFLFRFLKKRNQQAGENQRRYGCISSQIAWGSRSDPAEERAKRILAERKRTL